MIRAGQVGKRATCDLPELAKLCLNCDAPDDTEWDEKGRTMINYIFVNFDRIIRSIQFGYLEDGALVMSEMFGPPKEEGPYSSNQFVSVILGQDDYVTGLSGELGVSEGIRNLTFHTNRGNHGPIGVWEESYTRGSKINIVTGISDRREFGGFFGSHNTNCLSSIGIYASPIASSNTDGVQRENI
ncbi:unnamed protein product [Microthlaspi erraticum]|uniref:Jacalin-type lectin domain-containing protein n=1 Tax=Microthlaspi erraticum TaxID=1685480 RepID=A0A6D2KN95_9BRAS|nr:unnamed protein product [Microthlaspi erraticum]